MAVTSGHVLPCGCDVEQVWEAIDLSGGHARSCPHCAAVRESLLVLRAATAELVREEVEPPPGLVSRVMSAVRAEARRPDVLPSSGDGPARMSAHAVAAVLRCAADEVDGVRARSCRVSEAPESTGADPVIEAELDLAITTGVTAAAYREVRRRVLAAASARTGVRLARLDLVVSDLLEG